MGKKAQKQRQKKREQAVVKAQRATDSDSDEGAENENFDPAGANFAPVSCKHLKQVNVAIFSKLEKSELKECTSCSTGSGYNKKPKQGHKNNRKGGSNAMAKPSIDQMWACLQCGKTFCRANGDLHGMGHFAGYNRHSLFMNVKSQTVYCYGCRDEIQVDAQNPAFAHIRECAKQITTIFNGPSEVDESEIRSPDDADSDGDAPPSKPASFKETGPGGLIQGVKGLRNVGNTCFYNSIMQNIAQTVPLRERFVVSRDGVAAPKLAEGATTSELRQFMVSMWNSPEKVFSPVNLLNAIGKKYAQFRRRHQQDSHELLMCLLDLLSSEEKKILEIIQKAKDQVGSVSSPSSASASSPSAAKDQIADGSNADGNEEKKVTPPESDKVEERKPEPIQEAPESTASEKTAEDAPLKEDVKRSTETESTVEVLPVQQQDASPTDAKVASVEPVPTDSPCTETGSKESPSAGSVSAEASQIPLAVSDASATAPTEAANSADPSEEAAPSQTDEKPATAETVEITANTATDSATSAPASEDKAPASSTANAKPAAADPTPAALPSSISAAQYAKMLIVEKVLSENGIDKIFGGELESRITCHVCENRSTITEPFNNLSLQIPMKMLGDKFRQQVGLGSSGKRGKAAAKEKEREYPMKDEGGKMSKKERAQMFRLQQEREMAEQQQKSEESSSSSTNNSASQESPVDSAVNASSNVATNLVTTNEATSEATHVQATHLAESSAPESLESSPTPQETQDSPSPMEQPQPVIAEQAVQHEQPNEQPSSEQIPVDASSAPAAEEVKLPHDSAPLGTTEPQASVEPSPDASESSSPEPSKDDSKEIQQSTLAGQQEPESIDESATVDGEEVELKPNPVVEDEEEKEEDTVIEGHSNVYDGRRVPEEPRSGSLESCLYSFTDAELLNNVWGCYHCTRKAWLASGKDIFDLVLQHGTEEDQRAILVEKELIPVDADKATFLAALKSSAEKSRKRTKVNLLKRRATKQFLVRSQPRILALHLKRFMQISATKVIKLDADVSFPPTLDINPYATGTEETPAGKKFVYKLYGISSHSGGMGGGHYVAYTRRRPLDPEALANESVDQDWYYYSDTQLQATSLKTVLRQEAYVLFYERVLVDA